MKRFCFTIALQVVLWPIAPLLADDLTWRGTPLATKPTALDIIPAPTPVFSQPAPETFQAPTPEIAWKSSATPSTTPSRSPSQPVLPVVSPFQEVPPAVSQPALPILPTKPVEIAPLAPTQPPIPTTPILAAPPDYLPQLPVLQAKPEGVAPPQKSEQLPLPRNVPEAGKASEPKTELIPEPPIPTVPTYSVAPVGNGAIPTTGPEHTIQAPTQASLLQPHPQLGDITPVMMRNKTFGSPEVSLSRDFYLGENLGQDTAPNRTRRFGGFGDSNGVAMNSNAFLQLDYLLWWTNLPRIPVLASTNSLGTPGFLNSPGTQALLGPGTFGPDLHSGFRARYGRYFQDCSDAGWDASFFFLGEERESVLFNSNQFPVITRPFFALNFNDEFGEVVAQPGLSRGRLQIHMDKFIWGADVNYRQALCRSCDQTYGWFAGYRYLHLREGLEITEFITANGDLASDPIGTQVVVQDRFRTRNNFHGGQVGGFWSRNYGRWNVDLRASVALGVTHQEVEIDGFQNRTRPGEAPQNFVGGLLAAGPNIGRFSTNKFSVMPEFTGTLGYAITDQFSITAGYNFMAWSNVARPGDQIDPVLDLTFVPNPPPGVTPTGQNRPQVTFRQSNFWAQGINLGLNYRW